jgi:nascent polypeptide-associated complex subunit alpha
LFLFFLSLYVKARCNTHNAHTRVAQRKKFFFSLFVKKTSFFSVRVRCVTHAEALYFLCVMHQRSSTYDANLTLRKKKKKKKKREKKNYFFIMSKGEESKKNNAATVTDNDDDDSSSSDEMPGLDAAGAAHTSNAGAAAAAAAAGGAGNAGGSAASKQSRAEKKARKTVQKLGLKEVKGIYRVTIKKPKNTLFVIANPDVYKNPTSDTYIIFGQANVENTAEQAAQMAAAQTFDGAGLSGADLNAAAAAAAAAAGGAGSAADDASQTTAGEEGVSATDIELVMSQTSVTRAQAVAALKKNKGDIVNSIMELTM